MRDEHWADLERELDVLPELVLGDIEEDLRGLQADSHRLLQSYRQSLSK